MKKIFSFFAAMMLLVSTASATTIYCKMDKAWWTDGGAAIGLYTWDDQGTPKAAWPGNRMTPVAGEAGVWSFDLDLNTYKMCIFTRMNPSDGDNQDWGAKTVDLEIPTDGKNLFTITNDSATWGDPGCNGVWSVYGEAEMTAVYDWAGEIGTTVLGGNSNIAIASVKIHTNTDEVPAIKFGSSYVYADGKWAAIKPAEGGFKAGDVISVAAVYTNADVKYAQLDVYAADQATRLWRSDSASTINARLSADEPIVQTYTLEADQDSLLLGRYGNTGLFITMLKVERAAGETPQPQQDAPAAAPAAPTYPAQQVKAIYSATYNADCNFGEWGSGTVYTQEEYGKKYVTGEMGYFGLEFNAMDCSSMEKLHMDVWVAADASMRITPIWRHDGANGPEQGKVINLVGQQWNSIEIALSEYDLVTDWSDVFQIKIDQASNLTFWLNNVYFYTTVAPTVDLADGYYLIGRKGWTVYDIVETEKFTVNPENAAEYGLATTLVEGDKFKVVAVANNEIATWYPDGMDNEYVVDRAHAGEKIIYFRPDNQGGEDWYAGCIYVPATEGLSPISAQFWTHGWAADDKSSAVWDVENQKITVNIVLGKSEQWQAQVKYYGPVAEADKCYRVSFKMKANKAVNGAVAKYQDNAEMVFVSKNLVANVEYVLDTVVPGKAGGNGVLVYDFGYAEAETTIEISNIVIEEAICPEPPAEESVYYLVGTMTGWQVVPEAQYIFAATETEGEYALATTLTEGQGIKVVGVLGETQTWYPEGMGNEYVVDAAHAGEKTIYFRPAGNAEWAAFGGYIYIEATQGIENTAAEVKAIKTVINGQLVIIKGDKIFNATGAQIR